MREDLIILPTFLIYVIASANLSIESLSLIEVKSCCYESGETEREKRRPIHLSMPIG